jgi:hypothetical protein
VTKEGDASIRPTGGSVLSYQLIRRVLAVELLVVLVVGNLWFTEGFASSVGERRLP